MNAIWQVFRFILLDQRVALGRGALLSFVVLVMGAALLGLSGWFITAAAAAGLAGAGTVFDVFRPSAMVRFLALGRAAARYGERLLTHDATLRALEALRLRLLRGLMQVSHDRMIRLRGAQALNRLTADIDALDGVSLRLVLPVAAGLLTQMAAFFVLWLLVGLPVALWVLFGFVAGSVLIFWQTALRAAPLSRRGEAAAQAFRSRLIDLIRSRRDLAVHGRLAAQAELVLAADDRRRTLHRAQDRAERLAGAAFQMLAGVVSAGALGLGISMVRSGSIAPAFAAMGFFATLGLAETIVPLRRAAGDLGRMAEAARRVSRDLRGAAVQGAAVQEGGAATGRALNIEAVALNRTGSATAILRDLSLSVGCGETVALTGPSGIGKSTLLLAVAGLHPLASGQITIGDLPLVAWSEGTLRGALTLLPQRSALMSGSVADALCLAAPDSDDATFWQVLEAVQMADVLRARDGLDTQIGARADGFSGGEIRRIALARALLRRPGVLLLDEPTEGLDDATARVVLAGIRRFLPKAAILIAAHRAVETGFADRIVSLGEVPQINHARA